MLTPVDDTQRLWQVTDLLSESELELILTAPWLDLPWAPGLKQERWPRRLLEWSDPCVQQLSSLIAGHLPEINQALGTSYTRCTTSFWVDMPGFTVDMHTDGNVENFMQMFWISAGPEYGTGFYHYKNPASLRYQCLSHANTGYLVLNHLDDTGAQPLQWHGMFCPVPNNTIRVSSRTTFS